MATEWLNVAEMGKVYGFAAGTLYNWRLTGEGPPSVRLGRRVAYRKVDVEAWIRRLEEAEEAVRVGASA